MFDICRLTVRVFFLVLFFFYTVVANKEIYTVSQKSATCIFLS